MIYLYTSEFQCALADPEKELYAVIPEVQRIAWIWALIFAFALPEVGTFIRASRIVFFRNIRKAKWTETVLVWFFESAHVIGMGLMAFVILPELDVIKALMLTNTICFVPAMLSKQRLICLGAPENLSFSQIF